MSPAYRPPVVRSQVAASFGARVREAREAQGWSLATLASKLLEHGVKLNAAQVSKTELGQRATSIEELQAFASALHLQPARLLDVSTLGVVEKRRLALEGEETHLVERRSRLLAELDQVQQRLREVERGLGRSR